MNAKTDKFNEREERLLAGLGLQGNRSQRVAQAKNSCREACTYKAFFTSVD